jgi:hypothetical protein
VTERGLGNSNIVLPSHSSPSHFVGSKCLEYSYRLSQHVLKLNVRRLEVKVLVHAACCPEPAKSSKPVRASEISFEYSCLGVEFIGLSFAMKDLRSWIDFEKDT